MSYLFIALSFLFMAQTEDPEPRKISISATGKVELPANQVQFNININAEADNPQDAYKTHQEREKALVDLLDEYNIQEKDISYEPISISESRNYNREEDEQPTYRTRQTVNVVLRDFNVYEKIQVGLIEHNFDDFSGTFSTTDLEKGQEEALRKAIQEAKSKAGIISDEADLTLGSVINISYNHSTPQPYARETTLQMKAQSNSGSLLKYNQMVSVSATVSIQFEIVED